MRAIYKFVKSFFTGERRATLEELYLSQSGSLEELERRQKMISLGQAPWQSYKQY